MAIVKVVTILSSIFMGFTLANDTLKNRDCSVCPGPTNYYKELGCAPVFKNPEDCCPAKYDCSVLNNLADNQCLVSGHVYQVGETLREEDANECDMCSCASYRPDGMATFTCPLPPCALRFAPPGCKIVITNNCCGSRVICPKEDGSFATCDVDGKTYSDGEMFTPLAEPEKRCRCAEGYTGENIEPFCMSPKHTWCSNVIGHSDSIRNCAPVYAANASLKFDCNDDFRCPDKADVVIARPNEDGASESEDSHDSCKFGDLTMRVGDKLKSANSVECLCEVPPVLSCRRA